MKYVTIFKISRIFTYQLNNTTMTIAQESINYQVNKFIEYVRMGWDVEEAFEIAYDFIADDGIISKESFLNKCQAATITINHN